jgi:DNA-binding IclR family transcriptional regulator
MGVVPAAGAPRPARRGGSRRERDAVSRVQAVDRAVDLLEEVAAAGPVGAPLRALAAAAGLQPSTAHNLLTSLLAQGLLDQDPDSAHYRLGGRLLELARRFESGSDLVSVAAPVVRRVWQETGETVFLSVLRGGQRVDLAVLPSPHALTIRPRAVAGAVPAAANGTGRRRAAGDGDVGELHATAAGKIFLAAGDQAALRAALARSAPRRFTPHTLTAAGALLAELAEVRRTWCAVNREERDAGVCGVAAAVHDAAGSVVGALTIAYPAARASAEQNEALRVAVRAGAHAVSYLLGNRSAAATP